MDAASGRAVNPPRRSLAGVLASDAERLARGRVGAAVATLSDTALSIGVGQGDEDAVLRRARARGLPVLRRSSGGTAVLHLEGDLVWSLVLPRHDPRVGREFVSAYARLGAGVVAALGELGIDAAWHPSRGVSDTCCFLGHRGWALEAVGKVVGGAAQHLTSTHLLHQGALATRLDLALASEIFDLPSEVVARNLGTVAEAAGGTASGGAALVERLLAHLSAWVGASPD